MWAVSVGAVYKDEVETGVSGAVFPNGKATSVQFPASAVLSLQKLWFMDPVMFVTDSAPHSQ